MSEKRLIDANALIEYLDVGHLRSPTEKCFSEWDVLKMLRESPTVDAAEVVRCKDCKYFDGGWCYISLLTKSRLYVPPLHMTKETSYCSCGERRTDGA